MTSADRPRPPATGPAIYEIAVADRPEAWRAAGFHVEADGVVRVGAVRLRLAGVETSCGRGILSWSLADPGAAVDGSDDLDGLSTYPAPTEVLESPGPAAHPNGATRVDHVVVTTPDLPRTTVAFERRGFDVRRVRDGEAGGRPVRQVFFRAGEVIVELVGTPEPNGDAAACPPARFWGLAFACPDLDATKALLGDALDDPRDAVQSGRRIAALRLGGAGPSVPIAFLGDRR